MVWVTADIRQLKRLLTARQVRLAFGRYGAEPVAYAHSGALTEAKRQKTKNALGSTKERIRHQWNKEQKEKTLTFKKKFEVFILLTASCMRYF